MSISSVMLSQESYQLHIVELISHSLNVARFSQLIGKKMGLSSSELQLLFEAGFMHDIGKLEIPKYILWKPGRLTSEEKKIMDTHAIISERIILEILPLNETTVNIAKIVRYHHENWDGKGYPDKLQGNDIPLLSRVKAIADMFDAITKPRVYRSAPLPNPLKVMENELGKKLDEFIFRKYALEELSKICDNIY